MFIINVGLLGPQGKDSSQNKKKINEWENGKTTKRGALRKQTERLHSNQENLHTQRLQDELHTYTIMYGKTKTNMHVCTRSIL